MSQFFFVMPGFMPGIHVLKSECKDVDGRDKPGHDAVFNLQFLRLSRQQRHETHRNQVFPRHTR